MTRLAITTWKGRISPVFDVAEHVLFVDLHGTHEEGRETHDLSGVEPLARAQALKARDVDVVICGAISRAMAHALAAEGIRLVAGVCGEVERVLRAYVLKHLDDAWDLHLPGAWRQRHASGDLGGHAASPPGKAM